MTSKPPVFGVLPKPAPAQNEDELFACDSTPSFPEEIILRIYKNALTTTEMIRNISRVPGSYSTLPSRLIPFMTSHVPGSYSTLPSRLIPFMTSVPSLFFRGNQPENPVCRENYEQCLSAILEVWDMHQHTVQGDGNCCFTAAALNLTLQWKAFNQEEKDAFAARGVIS